MQPLVNDIRYYEGDSFTLIVFPKDSTGAAIDLTTSEAYFRLAQYRDDPTNWNADGDAAITSLVPYGPLCIKCDMTTEIGQEIKNGYVYDVGYWDATHTKRVTVLTGSFLVMSEVKVSGDTA